MAEGCTFHYAWAGFSDLFFLFDGQTEYRENYFLWRNCRENYFYPWQGFVDADTDTSVIPLNEAQSGIPGPSIPDRLYEIITFQMRDFVILYFELD